MNQWCVTSPASPGARGREGCARGRARGLLLPGGRARVFIRRAAVGEHMRVRYLIWTPARPYNCSCNSYLISPPSL